MPNIKLFPFFPDEDSMGGAGICPFENTSMLQPGTVDPGTMPYSREVSDAYVLATRIRRSGLERWAGTGLVTANNHFNVDHLIFLCQVEEVPNLKDSFRLKSVNSDREQRLRTLNILRYPKIPFPDGHDDLLVPLLHDISLREHLINYAVVGFRYEIPCDQCMREPNDAAPVCVPALFTGGTEGCSGCRSVSRVCTWTGVRTSFIRRIHGPEARASAGFQFERDANVTLDSRELALPSASTTSLDFQTNIPRRAGDGRYISLEDIVAFKRAVTVNDTEAISSFLRRFPAQEVSSNLIKRVPRQLHGSAEGSRQDALRGRDLGEVRAQLPIEIFPHDVAQLARLQNEHQDQYLPVPAGNEGMSMDHYAELSAFRRLYGAQRNTIVALPDTSDYAGRIMRYTANGRLRLVVDGVVVFWNHHERHWEGDNGVPFNMPPPLDQSLWAGTPAGGPWNTYPPLSRSLYQ